MDLLLRATSSDGKEALARYLALGANRPQGSPDRYLIGREHCLAEFVFQCGNDFSGPEIRTADKDGLSISTVCSPDKAINCAGTDAKDIVFQAKEGAGRGPKTGFAQKLDEAHGGCGIVRSNHSKTLDR